MSLFVYYHRERPVIYVGFQRVWLSWFRVSQYLLSFLIIQGFDLYSGVQYSMSMS